MNGRLLRSNEGSVLAFAMVVVVITGMIAASLFAYTSSIHKLNERSIASEKAANTAEAGLYRLIHYFNHPNDIPSNCASIKANILAFSSSNDPSVVTGVNGVTLVNKASSLNTNLIQFKEATDAQPVSYVTLLQILPKQTAATSTVAASPALTQFRFKCVAQARTTTNDIVTRTALLDCNYNPAPKLSAVAALISGSTVSANGHLNIHWGDAWAKQDFQLKLNSKINKDGTWSASGDNTINRSTTGENWVTYQSAQGYIRDNKSTIIMNDAAKWKVGEYGDASIISAYANALFQKVDSHTPAGQKTLSQKIDEQLAQFTTLNDNQKGYNFWKNAAIQRDTYFKVNADGSISDETGAKTFASVDAAMEYYRSLPDVYVAFFDTLDGLPPKADKSNWLSLKFNGSISACTKGLLYFCGNMNITGLPAPNIAIKNPDEVDGNLPASTTQRVFHNGIVFTWGDFTSTGNSVIYGSAIVNGKYDCGGTPNLYYNKALANGEPQPVSSKTNILMKQMYAGL